MDYSPAGTSVRESFQARILEWVAMPSSRISSQPRDQTHCLQHLLHWQVGSLPLAPPGKLVCLVASVMPDSLRPYGPWPARLFCSWDSPGKNTGWVVISFSNLGSLCLLNLAGSSCLRALRPARAGYLPAVLPQLPPSLWESQGPPARPPKLGHPSPPSSRISSSHSPVYLGTRPLRTVLRA